METYSSILLLVLLVLIVRESRAGTQAAKGDPGVVLERNERFRTLRMQELEPLVAVLVVGSLIISDLEREPVHALAALAGGVAGLVCGACRARSTYVAAVAQHKGIILRYSVESFVALGLLIIIKLVAERSLLPDGDIVRLVLAALLSFLLVESIAGRRTGPLLPPGPGRGGQRHPRRRAGAPSQPRRQHAGTRTRRRWLRGTPQTSSPPPVPPKEPTCASNLAH